MDESSSKVFSSGAIRAAESDRWLVLADVSMNAGWSAATFLLDFADS
jgi:hypothetical protein